MLSSLCNFQGGPAMKLSVVRVVLLVFLFALPSASVAQVDPGELLHVSANQCLADEQLKLLDELRTLDRRTTGQDQNWPFNPDYFIGKWDFEWDVPDTPVSTGGRITGSYTIKRIESCFYSGTIEADGPDGPYSGNLLLVYSPEAQYLTWLEMDSRGLTTLKTGPIGGDLGGYFTYHWVVPAFTLKGTAVRLAGTTFIGSPATFRYRPRISLDGSEFMNYGNPWFVRDTQEPNE